jgi:hypothetical protein
MTTYTDSERQTLRTAAFGAVYMVSKADPGFMDMVKESYAGSKALASSSPELKDLLRHGGMPQMPKGQPQDIEAGVLSALNESQTILQGKGGNELNDFRSAVTNAVDQVASAAGGGISQREAEAIGKVKAALEA